MNGSMGRAAAQRPINIQTSVQDAVTFAFRTMIEATIVLAAASCPSLIAAESPVEYPLTIPARAPHFSQQVSIRLLTDGADRKQLIDTHRMFRPEHRRVFLTLPPPSCVVALPGWVKRIDWQDNCVSPSAPSGKGSGCKGRAGGGAPGH